MSEPDGSPTEPESDRLDTAWTIVDEHGRPIARVLEEDTYSLDSGPSSQLPDSQNSTQTAPRAPRAPRGPRKVPEQPPEVMNLISADESESMEEGEADAHAGKLTSMSACVLPRLHAAIRTILLRGPLRSGQLPRSVGYLLSCEVFRLDMT